jgi:hypothetical protein
MYVDESALLEVNVCQLEATHRRELHSRIEYAAVQQFEIPNARGTFKYLPTHVQYGLVLFVLVVIRS